MLILSLSLLAALSLYSFSMNMIDKTADDGVAYNIARKALENAREAGFNGTNSSGTIALPDGTSTVYWDSLGQTSSSSATQLMRFKVVTAVASDKLQIGSTTIPAPDALRTVTVTVSYKSTGTQILQTGTLLARSGV